MTLDFHNPYRHGFVRAAVATPRVFPADPGANAAEILRQARAADGQDMLNGAGRCHLCEHAPCVAASRTGTDTVISVSMFTDMKSMWLTVRFTGWRWISFTTAG
jgi:hypothetical protein